MGFYSFIFYLFACKHVCMYVCRHLCLCSGAHVANRGQPWMSSLTSALFGIGCLCCFPTDWTRLDRTVFFKGFLICPSHLHVRALGLQILLQISLWVFLKENWLFFSQKLSVASTVFDKGGTSWSSLLSMLGFCLDLAYIIFVYVVLISVYLYMGLCPENTLFWSFLITLVLVNSIPTSATSDPWALRGEDYDVNVPFRSINSALSYVLGLCVKLHLL